jgi:phosphopantothenoylcysteine decarboxylase/phosphopantothenate--cysteine ligase
VLEEKNILLGVTGSIAAYKSVDLARRLMEEGANVNVVMTEAASRFITPYTLEAVTRKPVHIDLFENPFDHLDLPNNTDLFIIAPATANTINKLSCGIADDLISNIWLAYGGKALIAPAMNARMYRNRLVQNNIMELNKHGVDFVGPVSGSLACGEEDIGRMSEVPEIVEAAITALAPKDLAGQKIVVTAGPTIEPIDPVRYISNRSSGKMGYAVAKAALRRGATVTLISGPSGLKPVAGAAMINVETASQMEAALTKNLTKADAVIMAAAVADFSPHPKAKVKLEKSVINSLTLKRNTEIIQKLGKKKGKFKLIGFAAETGNNIDNAVKKLRKKNLDLIVLNDVTQKGAGFDVDTNIITIINKKGDAVEYPLMKKIQAADVILDQIASIS